MLSWEEARERLSAWQTGTDGQAVRRRVARLPRKAAKVGAALLGDPVLELDERGHELLENLSGRRRRALFCALLPGLEEHVERMWQDGVRRPYQSGWERRAFRAPGAPAAGAARRFDELAWVARWLGDYNVPDAAWVARWAPYVSYQPAAIGLLLAAVIDGGGRDSDAVLEVLHASADGEDEVGGMGRHVTTALLACGRPDAWEAVVRLLLAAQRQEGLRQVILEAADEAHPQAFSLLLDTILEHGLVHFSATARAAAVWLGLELWAGDERGLHGLLERTAALQRDPAARAEALGGGAADAYLALAATAWEDAFRALELAAPLLRDADPERRFAAVHLLGQLRLPEAAEPLGAALADPDLRVAARAFDGLRSLSRGGPDTLGGLRRDRRGTPDTFERLERFLARIDGAKVEVPAAVWPGTGWTLSRSDVAQELLLWGADRPVERLALHLDAMDPHGRAVVARRIGEAGTKGEELRGHVLALLRDPSPSVREEAVKAAAGLKLREEEVLEVEALLARKAGDLRRGAVALLLARADEAALGSADRLLADGRAQMRLGGLELLRRLVEADRSAAGARGRARAHAIEHPEPSAEDAAQLDALLEGEEAPPVTLADGLGLIDAAQLTPEAQPRDRAPLYVSEAAVALLRSLDALVHEHRDAEVEFEGYDGATHRVALGEIQWWPGRRGERVEPPLPEVWTRWAAGRPPGERDADGLELVRALLAPAPDSPSRARLFRAGLPDRAVRRVLAGGLELPELHHRPVTLTVIEWLVARDETPGAPAFALDVAESLLAAIPDKELAPARPPQGYFGPTDAPWRVSGWGRGLELARELRARRPAGWTREHAARLWRLERFAIRPRPAMDGGEVAVLRPPLSELTPPCSPASRPRPTSSTT